MAWLVCGVCGLSHRPAVMNSRGPARCYHCGGTERTCRCFSLWRRFVKWLRGVQA